MPAALSYPGVYIQEVPSGVRTVTGVATSITAFVGRAASGPICTATSNDQPPMLTSFADYERRFNLTVRYRTQDGKDNFVIENFGSVSTVDGDPRFLPRVLERESAYVRVHGAMPGSRPQSSVSGSPRSIHWTDGGANSGRDGT